MSVEKLFAMNCAIKDVCAQHEIVNAKVVAWTLVVVTTVDGVSFNMQTLVSPKEKEDENSRQAQNAAARE